MRRFLLVLFAVAMLLPFSAYAQVGIVEVQVIGSGTVSGLTIEVSRSISGRSADYAWQATTDSNGQAVVTVTGDAQSSVRGMYQARVRSASGTVARWHSIALRGGGRAVYEVYLSGQVRFVTPVGNGANTSVPSMLKPEGNWQISPLFTVGESVKGYIPPGILDGIGVMKMANGVVRAFVNHELSGGLGYPYSLSSGAVLPGGRVSYFDIDPTTRQLIGAGMAYDKIIGANGNEITDALQLNGGQGLRRPCSSALFLAGEFGLVDDIYFTGEEVSQDGLEYALDVKNGVLYALPWLGKAAWENVTLLDAGSGRVAVLVGDDRAGAPLILYLGNKTSGGFLERNGLASGDLYVWVADSGDRDPNAWNGTGTSRTGKFVKINHYDANKAGTTGYDALGFVTQARQDELADAAGAFKFSRPEDVATNPANGTQAVLASTGRGQLFASDDWGITYLVDVNFADLSAKIDVLYDGDDAGNRDFGIRSPDNLDWADDGMIYINEDRSTRLNTFGGDSGIEASIWKLNPSNGQATRIAVVNRAVLPPGQTDSDPTDLGDWETSGVLDVTSLFHTKPGERLLIANVQAHSVRDGAIANFNLVQGGQLVLMSDFPEPLRTSVAPMLTGQDGWEVTSLFTVGETINGYLPVGILDGIGAMKLNNGMVRLFVNHELSGGLGYAYRLASGAELPGARISYFDIDASTYQVVDAGMAYDTVIDAGGRVVGPNNLLNGGEGIRRLCSSALFRAGEFGLVDDVYLSGEEVSQDGLEYALDVENGVLYALPYLGKAAWENVTMLNTGNANTIAILIGDDRAGAPLILYIGQKNAAGTRDFLDRNGLARGHIYVWVADSGETTPDQWNGTGTSRTGRFVQINIKGTPNAPGYDAYGFATQAKQDELAAAVGAFTFSRPEDVATNPANSTQAVMASTGRGQLFASDDWGITYLIDVDFTNLSAKIDALYDGDDAGGNQFSDPDLGIRSPDNLDWADNGMIYINEDRSTRLNTFGGVSNVEASMWELNPENGQAKRIAVVNRSVLPPGQTDSDPTDLGDWETSGVLDVTNLFQTRPGERLLVADVQAHSVRDGIIADAGLVQGGQLVFLSKIEAAAKASGAVASVFDLGQNHPNPFNPATTIRYTLNGASDVRLIIYNTLGQEVRNLVNAQQVAGSYTVTWDSKDNFGRQVASGLYVYRLQVGNEVAVRKMLFMK